MKRGRQERREGGKKKEEKERERERAEQGYRAVGELENDQPLRSRVCSIIILIQGRKASFHRTSKSKERKKSSVDGGKEVKRRGREEHTQKKRLEVHMQL